MSQKVNPLLISMAFYFDVLSEFADGFFLKVAIHLLFNFFKEVLSGYSHCNLLPLLAPIRLTPPEPLLFNDSEIDSILCSTHVHCYQGSDPFFFTL